MNIIQSYQNLGQTNTDTQDTFKNLWGDKIGLDIFAAKERYHHLREIKAGDQTYDLQDVKQLETFLADLADGCLDGNVGEATGDIAVHDGIIIAFAPNGDEVKYDLKNYDDMLKFKRDSADGTIDGTIGPKNKKGANADANAAPPTGGSTTPASGSTTETGGSSETEGKKVTTSQSGPEKTGEGEDPKAEEAKKRGEGYKKGAAYAKSMSGEELLNKIKNGELPPEIAESQEAMQIIMMRVQEYQQMMALMTNLMKISHDINMATINNLR
jgi:hypothetical protein